MERGQRGNERLCRALLGSPPPRRAPLQTEASLHHARRDALRVSRLAPFRRSTRTLQSCRQACCHRSRPGSSAQLSGPQDTFVWQGNGLLPMTAPPTAAHRPRATLLRGKPCCSRWTSHATVAPTSSKRAHHQGGEASSSTWRTAGSSPHHSWPRTNRPRTRQSARRSSRTCWPATRPRTHR